MFLAMKWDLCPFGSGRLLCPLSLKDAVLVPCRLVQGGPRRPSCLDAVQSCMHQTAEGIVRRPVGALSGLWPLLWSSSSRSVFSKRCGNTTGSYAQIEEGFGYWKCAGSVRPGRCCQ